MKHLGQYLAESETELVVTLESSDNITEFYVDKLKRRFPKARRIDVDVKKGSDEYANVFGKTYVVKMYFPETYNPRTLEADIREVAPSKVPMKIVIETKKGKTIEKVKLPTYGGTYPGELDIEKGLRKTDTSFYTTHEFLESIGINKRPGTYLCEFDSHQQPVSIKKCQSETENLPFVYSQEEFNELIPFVTQSYDDFGMFDDMQEKIMAALECCGLELNDAFTAPIVEQNGKYHVLLAPRELCLKDLMCLQDELQCADICIAADEIEASETCFIRLIIMCD